MLSHAKLSRISRDAGDGVEVASGQKVGWRDPGSADRRDIPEGQIVGRGIGFDPARRHEANFGNRRSNSFQEWDTTREFRREKLL